jgi:hypothetical protein
LWHDGRFEAGTFESRIEDAIAEHGVFGSQGIPAADAYATLSPLDKQLLIQFLGSLGQVEFDSDGDGDVELNDFHGYIDTVGFRGCFASSVTPDDPCAIHDYDQDGDVDLGDFTYFVFVFDDELADCNENDTHDILEILLGDLVDENLDENNDGILDDCQGCLGDLDGDYSIGIFEILAIIEAWGPCIDCPADIDQNGVVNVSDLLYIVANWGPCP